MLGFEFHGAFFVCQQKHRHPCPAKKCNSAKHCLPFQDVVIAVCLCLQLTPMHGLTFTNVTTEQHLQVVPTDIAKVAV